MMGADLLDSLLVGKVPRTVQGSSLPRTDEGAFPTDLEVDANGYPSDARVEEIRLVAATRCREWLRDVFPDIWRSIPYGFADVTDDADGRTIEVVTSGWSGLESVIYAVLSNFHMKRWLHGTEAGGLYRFKLPRPLG